MFDISQFSLKDKVAVVPGGRPGTAPACGCRFALTEGPGGYSIPEGVGPVGPARGTKGVRPAGWGGSARSGEKGCAVCGGGAGVW